MRAASCGQLARPVFSLNSSVQTLSALYYTPDNVRYFSDFQTNTLRARTNSLLNVISHTTYAFCRYFSRRTFRQDPVAARQYCDSYAPKRIPRVPNKKRFSVNLKSLTRRSTRPNLKFKRRFFCDWRTDLTQYDFVYLVFTVVLRCGQ